MNTLAAYVNSLRILKKHFWKKTTHQDILGVCCCHFLSGKIWKKILPILPYIKYLTLIQYIRLKKKEEIWVSQFCLCSGMNFLQMSWTLNAPAETAVSRWCTSSYASAVCLVTFTDGDLWPMSSLFMQPLRLLAFQPKMAELTFFFTSQCQPFCFSSI